MNRYLFWILMVLPWAALTIYINKSEAPKLTAVILVSLFLYIATVLEFRRRAVGLSAKELLIAMIPFWGLKQRRKLYFSKP